MFLFHTKDIINAEFPFSLFDQETVCIKQKDERKDSNHSVADCEHRGYDLLPEKSGNPSVFRQGKYDKKQCCHKDAGKQVRQINLPVFPDAVYCKLSVKAFFHR